MKITALIVTLVIGVSIGLHFNKQPQLNAGQTEASSTAQVNESMPVESATTLAARAKEAEVLKSLGFSATDGHSISIK